jgi:PKD repeat protein
MERVFTKTLLVFILCLAFLTDALAQTCTASFSADKLTGCGQTTVQFTNTSSPIAGSTFVWDFGDQTATSTAVSPLHIFEPSTDGSDRIYRVKLTLTNSCGTKTTHKDITVRAALPVAVILPGALSVCAPYVLTVKNLSPGTSNKYIFKLYDGETIVKTIVKTDKTDVQISFDNLPESKTYVLNMVAQSNCGTAQSSSFSIPVVPRTFLVDYTFDHREGCDPLTINLNNVSVGATDYYYFIYDSESKFLARQNTNVGVTQYTFPKPGIYYIQLTGYNGCNTKLSAMKQFRVYAVPKPAFEADDIVGCRELLVTFTNKTPSLPDAQASSMVFTWDYGDGATATTYGTDSPPPHLYSFVNSPFTVSLTATDPSSGCADIVVKQSLLHVSTPPKTNFSVKPDTVTTIPNFSFSFTDETTGTPILWYWTFGDGKLSIIPNPVHTYADTGRYKVTLKVIDRPGCDSTITKYVHITGTPGQLFLPNAFSPSSSTTQLRTFMAKGSGIAKYHLQIFNKWGHLVWETTKLDSKGAPAESWDGNYMGQPAPQGSYVWQATATFLNGSDWKGMTYNANLPKRSGLINLIR